VQEPIAMPDFENLKKALLCAGEPKRVPLFDGSVHDQIKSRFLGKPVGTLAAEVEFFARAGYDYVPVTFGLRQTIRGETAGRMGAGRLESKVLKPLPHAAAGPTAQRLWAEEHDGLITDENSLLAFDWPDPDSYDYSVLDELARLMPDGMKAIVSVGYIFTASWMLMGMERFFVGLARSEPLVQRVIERVGHVQLRVVQNLLQYEAVGAIWMPDDLGCRTGLVVSPQFLRRYIFPWHKRIGELVRSKGLPFLFHSDGRLYAVLDDLLACGYHALHPCEPSSMDIVMLKRRYGGRLCLCGNIDLDTTLTMGRPAEVEAEVKQRLKTLAPGGGYCCGASNSVPEYVPFENYLAMIEAIKRYGRYPIRL